jgi:hypothetical protein
MTRAGSIGRDGFIARHGLWTEAQAEMAAGILARAR